MDKVTRYEWHGSWLILTLLGFFVVTIPIGIVYFMTHLLKIETQVADGTKLSEFLQSRKMPNQGAAANGLSAVCASVAGTRERTVRSAAAAEAVAELGRSGRKSALS